MVEPLDCPRQAWRLRQCPGRGDRRLCEEDSDTKISLFCSQRPPMKQKTHQQLVLHEAKGNITTKQNVRDILALSVCLHDMMWTTS